MESNEPEETPLVDELAIAPAMEETAPFDWEAEMKRYEAERLQ